MKNIALKLFYVVVFLLAIFVGMELIICALARLNKIELMSGSELAETVVKISKEDVARNIYIPHPYFGYIYTPSNSFFQGTHMKSNSDGFVDEEFPEKKEGRRIYAILGGSTAMSWGVEKREDRLSYQLEKLLNERATNDEIKEYKVLNMGVGSHFQYQATQIFLYYQDLLDGVIFYVGNNEASHVSHLATDFPVQYPEIDIYGLLELNSPLKHRIFELKQNASRVASFVLNNRYLLHSSSARFLFNVYFRHNFDKIRILNERLMHIGSDISGLPHVKGKPSEGRALFKKDGISPTDYWYGNQSDLQEKALRETLPVIYSKPLIDAYVVARDRNICFMSVIHPLSGAMPRKPECGKSVYNIPTFHKAADKILMEEAEKMEKAYGFKTHDLNNAGLFDDAIEDPFLDGTHATPEANRIIARYLFERIREEWHNK